MSLGPNSLQACPSRARRKDHRAHGVLCLRCEPDAEWVAGCPVCLGQVTAVGAAIRPHALTGSGVDLPCPGAGSVVHPPVRDAWTWPVPAVRVRARSTAVLRRPA